MNVNFSSASRLRLHCSDSRRTIQNANCLDLELHPRVIEALAARALGDVALRKKIENRESQTTLTKKRGH